MELVILTIGLEPGVISPALFATMVLMAPITTFMTTPLLEPAHPLRLIRTEMIGTEEEKEDFTILMPVSLPSSGPELLRVARSLAPQSTSKLYALHLVRPESGSLAVDTVPDHGGALRPLLETAHAEGVAVRPLSFASRNPGRDIAETAQIKGADLILMGWHKPVLSQSILSGIVHDVMQDARTDVAVYLARRYGTWKRVLVPYTGSIHDRGALELARRMAVTSGLEITILHIIPHGENAKGGRTGLSNVRELLDAEGVHLKVVESTNPLEAVLEEAYQNYDLAVIGVSEEWGLQPTLFSRRHEELARSCPVSMLMLRKYTPETTTLIQERNTLLPQSQHSRHIRSS